MLVGDKRTIVIIGLQEGSMCTNGNKTIFIQEKNSICRAFLNFEIKCPTVRTSDANALIKETEDKDS